MDNEQPDELSPVEEIKPCPYVNGFSSDNSGVDFMLKRYPNYSDFILFEGGRPSRCFRFDGFAIPMRESGCLSQNDNKKTCVSESTDGEKLQNIGELAIQHGLMDSPTAYAHRDKIEAALRTISDEGKSDAGIGFGGFDFWIKLQGIEYYFNVKPKSNESKERTEPDEMLNSTVQP